jgi:DNA-binding PadR family transcriptional regulator
MSQDLSQAFGRPATSSLRGLLPPRVGARWSEPPADGSAADVGPEDLDAKEADLDDAEPDDAEFDDAEFDEPELDDAEPEDTEPEAPDVAAPATPRRKERSRTPARRATAGAGRETASSSSSTSTNRRRSRVRVTSRDHVDLLVLLSLRQGPADGRGVITRLRETSDGHLDASERTIHVTLHRLARNRLLGRRLDPATGRRLYALSEAGERAARARLRQWRALTRGMDAVARAGD